MTICRKGGVHSICRRAFCFPISRAATCDFVRTLYTTAAQFKLKGDNVIFSYGYNFYLSAPSGKPPVNVNKIKTPTGLALFADAAQVNDFQDPASPNHPMLEEWYYLNVGDEIFPGSNYLSQRYTISAMQHKGKCDLFADGHAWIWRESSFGL